MDERLVYNLNVASQDVLLNPDEIKRRVPLTEKAEQTVLEGRHALERILDRRDHRLLVVVGPCSIHDPVAAFDYARRLKKSQMKSLTPYSSSCGCTSRNRV